VERHVVADDPYDSKDQMPLAGDVRSPVDGIIALGLLALSAGVSVISLRLLWRAVAD